MNAIRQEGGRTNQKQRTRLAIVQAAADLVSTGESPTVAEAADAAGVSRATAYRYFSSQEALLLEVLLHTAVPDIDAALAGLDDPENVELRLRAVVRTIVQMVIANETAFRAMLRGSLEVDSERKLRGGRRMGWFERALKPISPTLSAETFSQLVRGLSSIIGIEALIVYRDVIGIDDDTEIIHTIEESAVAMLRGTLPTRT